MKSFKYQLINDPRLFEICRDIQGNGERYSVYEVHLGGSHYEYLYNDNSIGEYTSTPESRLNPQEIRELGQAIEQELKRQSS